MQLKHEAKQYEVRRVANTAGQRGPKASLAYLPSSWKSTPSLFCICRQYEATTKLEKWMKYISGFALARPPEA